MSRNPTTTAVEALAPGQAGPSSTMSELEKTLKAISHPDAKVFGGHYLDHIIDEIALEGLDGITLQALGIRLEKRPNFEMEGFEDVAATTWNQLKLSKSLRFFVLPSDRPDLVKYSWDDYRDDRGNVYEPLHAPEDIYPYFPVEDKTAGLRGSCEHYQTRKDVSIVVRRIPFGSRLIIVAVQSVREKALFGTNFKKHQGTAWLKGLEGHVTRVKSLGENKPPDHENTPKNPILHAKSFTCNKSSHQTGKSNASVKFENCKCPALITVFHLPRFYKRIESVASLNARIIFTQLNQSETKSILSEPIVSKYGKHTLRNLLNQFPELLETAWETVSNPPFSLDEILELGTKPKKVKSKNVKVLRLKVSNLALQRSIIAKVLDGPNADDAEPAESGDQDEEKVSCKTSNSFSGIQVLRPYQELTSLTQSFLLFRALVRSGVKGLTAKDMTFLCTTRLEARSATRYLTRYHVAKEGVVKHFKQKSFTYTFNKFAGNEAEFSSSLHEPYDKVMSELVEMRKMLAEAKQKRAEEMKAIASCTITQLEDSNNDECPLLPQASNTPEINPLASVCATQGTGIIIAGQAPRNLIVEEENEEPEIIAEPISQIISPTFEKASSEVLPIEDENIDLDELPEEISVPKETEPCLTLTTHPTLTLVDLESEPSQKTKDVSTPSQTSSVSSKPAREILSDILQGSQVLGEKNVEYDEPEESSSLDPQEIEEVRVEATTKGVLDRSHKGDEVDEQIRKNMVRQRVDWNITEDRLILLAFIASALFIPRYNYLKVFIYNATQIRDLLLQRNADRRSAKTSLAIRRRLHFLMNQKSYYDVYVGMMGAALRDETLYLNYVKDFMRPPQPRIYHLPPMPALNSVIEYLSQKFDNEFYEVADTRGSLNGIETTLFMRQLTRLEYHWKALMFLLFCPLGNTAKTRHHFRKFWRKFIKDNRNVPETEAIEVSEESDTDGRIEKHETKPDISAQPSLESSVVSSSSDENSSSEEEQEIQKEDVVTMHPTVAEKKSSNNLECSTDEEDFERNSPDHLELEYCFKFMRFFMKHCEVLFRQMARLNASDGRKFSLVAFDMNATSPNICYTARECTSDLEIRLWTARSVILDHIMTGDASRKAEKSMLHSTKALPMDQAGRNLQRARILVYNKTTRLLGISKLMLRQLGNGLPSASYDDALDFVKYLEEAPSIDSSACINSGILSCLVELTDHFRSTIRITESIFTLNDEWVPVYDDMMEESDIATKNSRKSTKRKESEADEDSPRPMKRRKFSADEREEIEGIMECFEEMERELLIPKARDAEDGEKGNYTSSSTNALRLLRIRLNEAGLHMPGKQFTGFVERDFFSINLPNLEFTLRETRGLNHRVAGKSHPFSKDFMNDFRGHLIELAYHYIDADLDKTVEKVLENIGKYRILFELIDMAGSQGLSAIFLLTKFTKPSLAKGLHYLVDAKLIFTVGVKNRRFVTFNNSKDWLIAIRNQSNKEILGHAIMRPWLTAHGAISWVTVNRLVIALLGQLQKPSTDLDEVCQLLQPILSPVETLILIEILVKIKFLMVYKLTEEEPELFTQHPMDKSEIEYHVDTLVDTEDVFVSVSPYTTFLHAQLQEGILKECSTKPFRKCTTDDY
ncbi:General transcription factor 3C polypeptide 1 [Orchesella cincta]|uniref:General transcription factor 3C polypeptide 1 n=1 Tax=Orchesella cincta TaxID=48709 RepID=A0A1D2NAU4_ORCCI|nr:General transcription factor 3C polypeptide 1 [Orchesella cincta]